MSVDIDIIVLFLVMIVALVTIHAKFVLALKEITVSIAMLLPNDNLTLRDVSAKLAFTMI